MKALVVLSLVIGSPPKLDALVAAANKKDPVELDRVARRLGAGRLLHGLSSDKAEVKRATLEAAPRVDDCWILLVPATRLIASPDEQVAQAAVRAARRIAAQLTSGAGDLAELPRDVPREAVRLLVQDARTAELGVHRRAEALGVLATLAPVAAPARSDLVPLLDDPAVEVRRAAVDLLAPDKMAIDALARVIERDSQAEVAGGAAAAVCSRLPRAAAGAWTRLRALALDGKVDPADAVDLLACLAAGGTDDRALVVQAAKSHPTPFVRTAAVELAKTAAAGQPPILRPASTPR